MSEPNVVSGGFDALVDKPKADASHARATRSSSPKPAAPKEHIIAEDFAVLRLPKHILINLHNNESHPKVQELDELLRANFRPFAATPDDTQNDFVYFFRG